MRKFRPRRPSGAMLVALLALFVALGGSSYAALTITSANIKNGTIQGVDIHNSTITGPKLKNNTLNGRQINESRLGTVPSASNATHANTASNADTATNAASAGTAGNVNGLQLRKFAVDIATSAPSTPLLDFLGLTLKAGCSAGNISDIEAANTSGVAATIDNAGVSSSTPGTYRNGILSLTTASIDLNQNGDGLGGGTAAYFRQDGVVVTIVYHWRNDRFSGAGCRIFGTATGG